MASVLRFVTYAALAPFVPLVRLVLVCFAFAGFAGCIIGRLLMHDPRFPLGIMLVMSVGACIVSAALGAVLQRLAPQ